MDEKEPFVDYYKVLQCSRSATNEELKKSYQRLLLTSHPDKVDTDQSEQSFILIQEAWTVLRNQESRKLYDARLICYEHSELFLYDNILKSEMEYDASENVFTHFCRCGGTYVLDASESLLKDIVISCDECSFSIVVKSI